MIYCEECCSLHSEAKPIQHDPKWLCWVPGYGQTEDNAVVVVAKAADWAAEKFSEIYDDKGDYEIVNSSSAVTVLVREMGPQKDVIQFSVSGESVREYTATPTEL